jgi:ribulose-5-phosphate 4-epimerase/fuculose-1-phosphate aldolase
MNGSFLNEEEARLEIVKWGKEIYTRGLVNGSGGNISIRISADTVLSTPSGWSLGHMTTESITKTTIKGELLAGLKPTKELPMHLAVYEARPDISAVAHTHSIYALTYACTMEPGHIMPPYVPSLVAKVGTVKLTPFRLPASRELGEVVAEGIASSQAVLLENHGVLAVGKTLEAAIGVAFEVDDNAKIYFLSGGKARPLPEDVLSQIKANYI